MKVLLLMLCAVVMYVSIKNLTGSIIGLVKEDKELTRLRIENAYLEGVKVGREGGDHEKRWEELERELCKP